MWREQHTEKGRGQAKATNREAWVLGHRMASRLGRGRGVEWAIAGCDAAQPLMGMGLNAFGDDDERR